MHAHVPDTCQRITHQHIRVAENNISTPHASIQVYIYKGRPTQIVHQLLQES